MDHFFKKEVPALCTALLALVAALSYAPSVHSQTAVEGPLEGWAWSDTIGWVSLQGSNYGLEADSDGIVTGYAWSDNVGWIRPAGGGECPDDGAMRVGDDLEGWFKVVAGNTAQSGGWDGCIALQGSSWSVNVDANPSFNPADSGAWGSEVVGWLAFDSSADASSTPTEPLPPPDIQPPPPPPPTGCLAVEPMPSCEGITSVRKKETARLYWDIAGADTCTLNGAGVDMVSPAGGWQTPPIEGQTRFTLVCVGLGGTLEDVAIVNVTPETTEI